MNIKHNVEYVADDAIAKNIVVAKEIVRFVTKCKIN